MCVYILFAGRFALYFPLLIKLLRVYFSWMNTEDLNLMAVYCAVYVGFTVSMYVYMYTWKMISCERVYMCK